MRRHALPASILALVLAACAGQSTGGSDAPATDPPPSTPPTDGPSMGGVDQETIDRVVAQAADDTDVPEDEISVVAAEAVTWSDGALGCPEEGMMYTQALVPGYRVVLDVAGEELHYHAGSDGTFAPCDDPQPPAEGGSVDS